jgi:hypothetical protein
MPDSDLTQVGIFMGTPGYAPPEAIREGTDAAIRPVGPEAWAAWGLERLAPRALGDRVKRRMQAQVDKLVGRRAQG